MLACGGGEKGKGKRKGKGKGKVKEKRAGEREGGGKGKKKRKRRGREGGREEEGEGSPPLCFLPQGLQQSHGGTKRLEPRQAWALAGSQPPGQPRSCARRLEVCKRPRAACPAGRGAACVEAGPLELSRGSVCGQSCQGCGVSRKAAQPGSGGAERVPWPGWQGPRAGRGNATAEAGL